MKLYVNELVQNKQNSSIATHVRKRDGQITKFDPSKIANAILKAFEASFEGNESIAWEITGYVISKITSQIIDIEQIQDLVEDTLMNMGYRKTAKLYILYRAKRAEARNISNIYNAAFCMIDSYINDSDWKVRENSNMSYSLQGLNNQIASTMISEYWLNKIYTQEITTAHKSGAIHIHDLGSLSSYCVGWDLEQLLILGFTGVSSKVESKPAKHFRTALGQIANFFYTLQGEAAGAQALSNFDTLLAPFIREDNLSYKEVKQSMQEFIFNLNVPTRTGFQTPFTNITFDLTVPSYFAEKSVIIGGQLKEKQYCDYKKEMQMILQAFCEVMLEGDGKGRPFTFPIPTINLTKEFDFDNKAYDPLWELTAKYGSPYFSNFINSSMSVEDSRSMCCRLKLDNKKIRERMGKLLLNDDIRIDLNEDQRILDKKSPDSKNQMIKRGGIFASNPMTGSIGVVTINLPKIAYLSLNEEQFFNRLNDMLILSKTTLELKRKAIEDLTSSGLFPYTKFYLSDIKKRTGYYWINHFSTIGLIGMNEAVANFLKIPYTEPDARDFASRVLDFMLEKVEQFSDETGNMFNLEASPAEGASYRLAMLDKKEYSDIITAGSDLNPYYTNSVALPVDATEDIFEVCDHQDPLQSKFTGGTVLHIFIGEQITDTVALKNFIKLVANNYHLPYFSITPTFSICPVHGYEPCIKWICDKPHTFEELEKYGVKLASIEAFNRGDLDDHKFQDPTGSYKKNIEEDQGKLVIMNEVYSRVVGYYRPVQNWNNGKREEFYQRKHFKIKGINKSNT